MKVASSLSVKLEGSSAASVNGVASVRLLFSEPGSKVAAVAPYDGTRKLAGTVVS